MEQRCCGGDSGCAFALLILLTMCHAEADLMEGPVPSANTNNVVYQTEKNTNLRDMPSSAVTRLENEEEMRDIIIIRSCLTDASVVEDVSIDNKWQVPVFAHVKADMGNLTLMLEQALPFCGLETQEISLFHNGSSSPTLEGERHGKAFGFLRNGFLKIDKGYFSPEEYCVTWVSHQTVGVRYCEPECSLVRPCVPKCSPPGDVLGFFPRKSVVPSGTVEFKPRFYDQNGPVPYVDSVHPHFVQMRPKKEFVCESSMPLTIIPYSEHVAAGIRVIENKNIHSMKFRMMTDGRLLYQVLDDHNCPELRELKPQSYCLDGIRNVGAISPFSNYENETVIFTCTLPSPAPVVSMLVGIGMLSCSVFLLLIVIVYGLLWQQQNTHGWTVVGHSASMFFTYIFVGLAHIMRIKLMHLVGTPICYAVGVLAHFFFLSTFCWLTLISFDLWWTFRSLTPSKNTQGYRLLTYFLIGWGVPALIVLVSVCLDLAIGNDCTSLRLPKYGQNTCYITESSQGLYFYYPVGISLICNLGFFVVTLYKLYHYKQRASAVSKKEQQNSKLLLLFSKLFFVMGITWVFEFVSWLHVGVWVNWFWAIMDVINILQAVAIFFIYVWKQDVLESLEKRYPGLTAWVRNTYCVQWCSARRQRRRQQQVNGNGEDSVLRTASSAASPGHEGQDRTKVSSCPADESP